MTLTAALRSRDCDGSLFLSLAGEAVCTIYAWVAVAAVAVTLLLGGLHGLLQRHSGAYRRLRLEQRLVTVTHLLFGLAYAAQVVPHTYLVARLLFGADFLQSLTRNYTQLSAAAEAAFAILNSHLMMYSFEAALRLVVRRNLLLLTHHTCFFVLVAVGLFKRSFFVLKLGLIFDLFATYECALFASLAARRLGAGRTAVRLLLAAGLLVYAVTRMLQLVVLVPFFAGSYAALAGCGQLALWWAILALTALLLAIQLYTFKIYAHVWRHPIPAAPDAADSDGTLTASASADSLGSDSTCAVRSCYADKLPMETA